MPLDVHKLADVVGARARYGADVDVKIVIDSEAQLRALVAAKQGDSNLAAAWGESWRLPVVLMVG